MDSTMNDVGTWLVNLGLGQYAQPFAAQDTDFGVLTQLSDSDLRELGVTSMGHRKRLIEAFAALKSMPTTMVAVTKSQPSTTAPLSETAITLEAERRQLTVMFCDLVGSTALSSRLDPEDMQALIRRYHGATASAVAPYAGHDDDAARAVRAALESPQSVVSRKRAIRHCVRALASPPASSWSGRSAWARRRPSCRPLATRSTWPRGCRAWPCRVKW
jgi:hypothetical protein